MVELSEREEELPDLEIGKLLQIAVERPEIISLGPGEPDFPAAKEIVTHTKKIADKVNHYSPPGGRKELKEAISKKLLKENKVEAHPSQIVVTCGSQEALLLATACTLDVSEHIILPNPSFMGFLPTFELFNAGPRFVELKEETGYAINPDDVKKAINKKKTKVLLINSPANPTGNVLTKKILEELADIAIENDLYIFSDEAYEKIIYDDAKHISIGSLNGMSEYTATFHSFSKTAAMCGYRVGYVAAPPKLADAIKDTHIYTTVCAPTISQMLALKSLKMGDKYVNKMIKEYDRRRRMLVPRLNEMGLSTPMPKGAFYAFSNISSFEKNSKRFVLKMIKKAKVAAVPGIDFGSAGEGHVRFSYATDYKLIEKALDRLEPFIKKYK
ncbi:aminotransferase class I/II-fold pyridoxal phosphate-dependent enzyme [Candidatus Woesearchaeota archaeon]|nr:aminotransferase class I/II-fold pyridoxal phosphate-dependent enzyme [Candidatus Woesearchaeota archaeon]